MSYLERLDARAAMSTANEPAKGAQGGFDPFAGDPLGQVLELPPGCVTGLDQLRSMHAPRIAAPEVWPEVVADALRLASEGWATKALALGWEPIHLWGCSPDIGGNQDHDGLALILAGQRVVLLDASAAIIDAGKGRRCLFTVRPMPGAVLVWDLGQKQ